MRYVKISIIVSFLVVTAFAADAQNPLKSSEQVLSSSSKIELDTISDITLEQFIKTSKIASTEATALQKFYTDRDYRMAWFSKDHLTEHAQSFWNRYTQYLTYSRDSSFYDARLHKAIELVMSGKGQLEISTNKSLELALTHHFYTFVQRVFIGRIDPVNFEWHIPRKKTTTVSLFEKLLANDSKDFDWLPVSEQYLKMRTQLIILQNRQKNVEEKLVLYKNKLVRPGDSSITVSAIKKALHLRGDLKMPDTSMIYSPQAVAAVMNFQARYGLGVDGIIGPNVIKTLNVPLSSRIKQLMINMERMRWIPERTEGTAVWINIPEYKLYVFQNNAEILKMDIVVGKEANRTVIFSDKIQHVVFSPYWNIPESIVRNEILPAMNRNSGYLASHDMEITGRRNGLPIVRQKPGNQNSLGKVKFIFPNQYSIYLHDTPSKYLFDQSSRAFSHGCIRLSDPVEFAKFLLKDNPFWTDIEIDKAMNAASEKWVKIAAPVPVVIGYFTAWVDSTGQLNFREDIYGHDKRMADQLFDGTER